MAHTELALTFMYAISATLHAIDGVPDNDVRRLPHRPQIIVSEFLFAATGHCEGAMCAVCSMVSGDQPLSPGAGLKAVPTTAAGQELDCGCPPQ
eukprot:1246266-Pleurochrysis_carterae.AAC.1